jgi:hypothetical protein
VSTTDVPSGTGTVRRIDLDGTIRTIAGPIDPPAGGTFEQASATFAASMISLDESHSLVATAGLRRILRLQKDVRIADVVAGYDLALAPAATPLARFNDIGTPVGLAFDGADVVYLADREGARILAMHMVDPDVPLTWTLETVLEGGLDGTLDASLDAPAGLAFDAASGRLLVVDEGAHCVRALDVATHVLADVAGECGTLGFHGDGGLASSALLLAPAHVALGPEGRIYIADTGNHRVRVVEPDGTLHTVIGDGSQSSSGVGSPARLFPVDAPRQLGLDSFGSLFVASTNTVRVVANVDGDAAADGDDLVLTAYGAPPRDSFPASATRCLSGLIVVDDGTVEVADACQGIVVRLTRTTDP